jgi:hypothetical protein
MPRRARLDAPGTLHHVIVRGIERRRIVNNVADRKNFLKRMRELAGRTKTTIYAWALMTNMPYTAAKHRNRSFRFYALHFFRWLVGRQGIAPLRGS